MVSNFVKSQTKIGMPGYPNLKEPHWNCHKYPIESVIALLSADYRIWLSQTLIYGNIGLWWNNFNRVNL
jgi:hypothetical protein